MRNSKNYKYCLGAGITGLIYAFYNPDTKVISKEIGGKLSNQYMKYTVLLHDTELNRKLLTDLKIKDFQYKAQIIRYFVEDKIVSHIPSQYKELMIRKKLTDWQELEELSEELIITDQTLSVEDNYIPILEVNLDEIIKALSKKVEAQNEIIMRITDSEIVTNAGRYRYEELVSTIPAPIFWDLYGKKKDFKYHPISFIVGNKAPNFLDEKFLDLVYFPSPNQVFTRMNKTDDNKFLYEITGKIDKPQSIEQLKDLDIQEHWVDPFGVIYSDLNNIPPPNVRFLGRFATWNHSYKIQDAIKDSLNKFDFLSVWNKQKEFNSHFFNFNTQDPELQQKLTKEFVLHITEEAHELLREINWKMNRYKEKEIDRSKIVEEWIDVGKFWLGLGNVWGVSIDEFFREFWKKSKIVDERYKKYLNLVEEKNAAQSENHS